LENPKTHFPIEQRQHETIMESMIMKTSTPLFEGSSTNVLSTMLLLNLKIVHGVSNIFMEELFSLLRIELLPKGTRCQPQLMRPLS
jgi:hypothetical protein